MLEVQFVLAVVGTLMAWTCAAAQNKPPVEVVPQMGHTGGVTSVAFSPDGRFVLSGSDDKTLKLWEVATGNELRSFSGHADGVNSVAFSPDGRLALSGGHDGTTRIWDVKSGLELVRMMEAVDGEWLTITPDGFFVASPKGSELLTVVRGLESYSASQFHELVRPRRPALRLISR